jgi:copper chaperone
MTTITLSVSGMTCGGCEQTVAKLAQRVPGVTAVTVSRDSGRAVVTADRPIDAVALAATLSAAGYDARPEGA